ncbi:DUF4981 domain-containing protein [Streptomyces sp. NPDC002520]
MSEDQGGGPAGRAGAGLYDNAVAVTVTVTVALSGHSRAHDGRVGSDRGRDLGGDRGGDLGRDFGGEARAHQEPAAPVGIRCFRHEGIVLRNQQLRRGLDWLAATWELSVAGRRVLSAPAELPGLRPGETAAVPLPFALPRGGGDMWLTLRVTTVGNESWAPRGTEVCAPRVPLIVTAAPGLPTPSEPPLLQRRIRRTRVYVT